MKNQHFIRLALIFMVLVVKAQGFEIAKNTNLITKNNVPKTNTIPPPPLVGAPSRRHVVESFCAGVVVAVVGTTPLLVSAPLPAMAATNTAKVKPSIAFEKLTQADRELRRAAQQFLPSRDYEGLRNFLAQSELSNFELYSTSILASKLLSEEDKKAIGTIRTYGAGADVMIMYGGLVAELDDTMWDVDQQQPNYANVVKYMTRTLDALSEVLAICRNSGSF